MRGQESDTLCVLCSNHLPARGWTSVLLLPLVAVLMTYTSAWNKSKCYKLSTCVTFFNHCYYNPHLTSFHTLPLTFDLMGFFIQPSALCVSECVWNDKRPNQGPSIWAYLESYYWATMVQVNRRYTGTSIYLHIFILFCPLWRFTWFQWTWIKSLCLVPGLNEASLSVLKTWEK